jgi:hypothetical protein
MEILVAVVYSPPESVVTLSMGGGISAETSCGREITAIVTIDTRQRTLILAIINYSETHKPPTS